MNSDMDLGPIDFVVIEFPEAGVSASPVPHLQELVATGVIRILDIDFFEVDSDGLRTTLSAEQVAALGGVGWLALAGEASDVVTEDELDELGRSVTPGYVAVAIVFENSWAGPFATSTRKSGGNLVTFGRIPTQALAEVLDSLGSMSA